MKNIYELLVAIVRYFQMVGFAGMKDKVVENRKTILCMGGRLALFAFTAWVFARTYQAIIGIHIGVSMVNGILGLLLGITCFSQAANILDAHSPNIAKFIRKTIKNGLIAALVFGTVRFVFKCDGPSIEFLAVIILSIILGRKLKSFLAKVLDNQKKEALA